MIGKYVVIATDKRGVFAGVLAKQDESECTATLRDARQCLHWSAGTRGLTGLAAIGPQEGSRVTPAAPVMRLYGVHYVTECSNAAQSVWESGPWA